MTWVQPLSLIVAVQILILAAGATLTGKISANVARRLSDYYSPILRHIALGISVGLIFDIFAGSMLGIFTYPSAERPHSPLEIDLTFLIFNVLFSYSIFSLTIAQFTSALKHAGAVRPILVLPLLVAAVIVVLVSGNGLLFVFACGVIFLSAVELMAFYSGRPTPLGALPKTRKWFATLALSSAVVGFFYEVANLTFNLWDWTFLSASHDLSEVALVVLFGYFVLAYPFAVFHRKDV